MFEVRLTPTALRQLKKLKRFHAVQIINAMERHLSHEPDRPAGSRIKKLRGEQAATFRMRVGHHRVFYDVDDPVVTVIAVLHKSETAEFYREGKP